MNVKKKLGKSLSERLFRPLIQRCEFMETNRTRCNRTPIIGTKNGLSLCKNHYKKVKQDNQPNLEAFINPSKL